MRYYAATVRPVAGVFRFIACINQHLIACVIAVDCREAGAFAYQMGHCCHEFIRGIGMDTHAQAGLMCQSIFCCFQAHIRQFIGSVFPISGSAAYCQVLELVITSEEISCIGGNCPNPFRKFQPQAFDQFLCFIFGDDASIFICFIIRIHILVETSGVPSQRVFRQNAAQLCEPHELHGFPERFGRIFRNHITDFCNLQQFCFSGFVSFFRCHFSCFFRITICQTDDTIAYQYDGAIEFNFFCAFQRCSVQFCQICFRFLFDAAEAFFEQHVLIVRSDFPYCLTPFGVCVYKTCIHSHPFGFFGNLCQKCFFQRFMFPIRENFFSDKSTLFICHFIRVLCTGCKGIHFTIHPCPGEFRCQDAAFAKFTGTANDEFIRENIDTQFITGIIKCLGAANGNRLPFRSFMGFCPDARSFIGNGRLAVYIV